VYFVTVEIGDVNIVLSTLVYISLLKYAHPGRDHVEDHLAGKGLLEPEGRPGKKKRLVKERKASSMLELNTVKFAHLPMRLSTYLLLGSN